MSEVAKADGSYLSSLQQLGAQATLLTCGEVHPGQDVYHPGGHPVLSVTIPAVVLEALVAVAAAAEDQLKANRVVMQGWSKQSADELFAADRVLSGRVAALRAAVEGETKK